MEAHIRANILSHLGATPNCSGIRNSWRDFNQIETEKGPHQQPHNLWDIRLDRGCFFRLPHHLRQGRYRQITPCAASRI